MEPRLQYQLKRMQNLNVIWTQTATISLDKFGKSYALSLEMSYYQLLIELLSVSIYCFIDISFHNYVTLTIIIIFSDPPPVVLSKFPFSCAVNEQMSVIFKFSISINSEGLGVAACTRALTFGLHTSTNYTTMLGLSSFWKQALSLWRETFA